MKLQRLLWIAHGGRNVPQDRIEERLHVVALGFHVWLGVAAHATAKQVREIALVVVGTQLKEQVENLVDSYLGVNASPVNLVYENDRAQPFFECFFKHKSGLGHGPLVGINNQQAAINHAENPLHLTAEISVARGVNNVDTNSFVIDGGVF